MGCPFLGVRPGLAGWRGAWHVIGESIRMTLYTGCSGFHYREWKGPFYPEDLPQKSWLAY